MRNLELKARCADLAAARAAVRSIGARLEWTRRQVDTYFATPNGRLKLREEGPGERAQANVATGAVAGAWAEASAELIFYRRPDAALARVSEYDVLPIPSGPAARALLSQALGVAVRVAKTRALFLLGPTRIHLDAVDGLGEFVEIERVMAAGEPEADARGDVDRVAAALGVAADDLVPSSYSDLLLRWPNADAAKAAETRPDTAPAHPGDEPARAV